MTRVSRAAILCANAVCLARAQIGARSWRAAARRCRAAQWSVLRSILLRNHRSRFGREHGFDAIDSVRAFQQAVPIRTYGEFQPYVERIAAGDPDVLTTERVRRFGVTGGSTTSAKLVPYTDGLLSEFEAGAAPWLARLLKENKALRAGRAYWAVTPAAVAERRSTGGIPVGFDDEPAAMGALTGWALSTLMAAPLELARIRDLDAFRYATLKLLVRDTSLCWMSAWSPASLMALLQPLPAWGERIVVDIRQGRFSLGIDGSTALTPDADRAAAVEAILAGWEGRDPLDPDPAGRTLYEAVWPNLVFVSCWGHGTDERHLPRLRRFFPHAVVEPKGLVATEAFVSFPWDGDASALALTSHFFEFEEVDEPWMVRLAHEVKEGRRYSVIVTTSGGLYRYRLGDIVEVVGKERECPLIRFVGKEEHVSDLCGERLVEGDVRELVGEALATVSPQPAFWMLAPELPSDGAPFYALFVQRRAGAAAGAGWDGIALAEAVERSLYHNLDYGTCRRAGDLDGVAVFEIDPAADAYALYRDRCVALGQRPGDVDLRALHSEPGWSEHFPGAFAMASHPAAVPAPGSEAGAVVDVVSVDAAETRYFEDVERDGSQ